jgi:tungstate transport system permease protein
MPDILASFSLALRLIAGGDAELWRIVALSIEVSLASALAACALGLPIGAFVAVEEFAGRRIVIVLLNSLLGLPSVVVGLVVYLLLSRAGPLGTLGILFTPKAIVVAQTLLVLPIVAALARQLVEDAWRFGRAASEVGAVMIVGGNIDGVTRVMSTTIALETSKGDLPLALGLGFILLAIVLALNAAAYGIGEWSAKHHG